MTLVDDTDPDWLEIELAGKHGFVPRTYVEEFQEGTSVAFSEWDERGAAGALARARSKRMTIFAQRFETLAHAVDADGYAPSTDGPGSEAAATASSSDTPSTDDTDSGTDTNDDGRRASTSTRSVAAPLIVRLLYDYEVCAAPHPALPIRIRSTLTHPGHGS